ncbi:MAG: hypothetical protein CUN52_04260 [Phototrophicales bacterium]|nr:MAG: hypothetical protein CUN52_04260 [Phototrophicales bacterium]
MKKMFVLSLLLGALMALFIPTTSAQMGGPVDLCFGLSQADCAVINNATANMATVTSFVQTFTLNVEMSGFEMPDMSNSMSFQVTGSGPVSLTSTGLNLNLPMTATIGGMPAEVGFHVVDDVVYLALPEGVIGIQGATELAAAFLGDTLGSADALGSMGSMLSPDMLLSFLPVNDYITHVRQADTSVMGMTLSPFVFSADISGMINSPEVSMLISSIGPMLGGMGGADVPAEVGAALQALPTLLQSLNLKFDATQYVGSDNYIHKLTFNFNFAIDPTTLAGMVPGGIPGVTGPITMAIKFDVELTEINQPQTITAPEGATIFTAEQLMGMLGGMLP